MPGVGNNVFAERGISAPLPNLALNEDSVDVLLPFVLRIKLTGSGLLKFQPLANNTEVRLASNWQHPSFTGRNLPLESKTSVDGFEAVWKVSEFGREFSQVLPLDRYPSGVRKIASAQSFGVRFFVPVDIHSMTNRAIKYANLLMFITFVSLFLFEICSHLILHPMHSLLVGAALSLFYLLLLSLGEHFGFGNAYAIATIMVVFLIAGYARSILRAESRALILGSQVGLQYLFFYILLSREDFALVSGSLGTTLLLGIVMYLTRNVDWTALGGIKAQPVKMPQQDAVEISDPDSTLGS